MIEFELPPALNFDSLWFSLVWFYGISTIVGYLMPNPSYTYTLKIWFLSTFFAQSAGAMEYTDCTSAEE